MIGLSFELGKDFVEFLHLEKLIDGDVCKILARIGSGPPDLDVCDPGTMAEPDVLLKR